MKTQILGIAWATLVLLGSAYADAIFIPGDHPQSNENIVFKTDEMGPMVNGFTNHSDTMVVFTSTVTITAEGGQSDIDSENPNSGIRSITVTVPGNDFLNYIFNPVKANGSSDILVTAFMSDGKSFTSPAFGERGDNLMTVIATRGDEISRIEITSNSGFASLAQNQISVIAVASPVPEPSSMLLMGSGLLAAGVAMRRKLS